MNTYYGNPFKNGDEATASPQSVIGTEEIRLAAELLCEYKNGKQSLEGRVVDDEEWWKLRHWNIIKGGGDKNSPAPTSAWLFNAIINKHADAMDNYPTHTVLPRERDDEQSAKALSAILPVVLEYNDYEKVYSDAWYDKLKHGTAVYGCFWDSAKEGGLGDISIRNVDLLKIFWEPGITDIQNSANLFIVDLCDNDILKEQYPDILEGKSFGNTIDIKQYKYDDTVSTENKSVVVDWYYKIKNASGKAVLHYVKFVGDTVLFASQNMSEYHDSGWYAHGMYPVVFDTLFPEKDTPCGFGYVSICKDPQLYIDRLSANILENSMMSTKKRFFASENTNVNIDEFLDWNSPIVHCSGEIDETRLKEITVSPVSSIYLNVLQMKIEEMKDTAANRDVNSGGIGGGVTAASAIAALQEAGNKVSRDMISASYRVHTALGKMCIELMRQFYDERRAFRIIGENGEYEFAEIDNSVFGDIAVGTDSTGMTLYRHPIFDLKVSSQKRSPFSRMSQNELAKELYRLGFFNAQRADETLAALDLMDFEGIEKLREKVKEGQTLLNTVTQMQAQMAEMAQIIQGMAGEKLCTVSNTKSAKEGTKGNEPQNTAHRQEPESVGKGRGINNERLEAHTPQASYGEQPAKHSKPSME